MKIKTLVICAITAIFASCTHIEDSMIPASNVNIDLTKTGYWVTYGLHNVGGTALFNRNDRIPANFPFTANTYTGFGGVLLVLWPDINTLQAYDAACPVEHKQNVRVQVPNDSFEAVCPVCGSHFDILNGGYPTSGQAKDRKYGLKRYRATGDALKGFRIIY